MKSVRMGIVGVGAMGSQHARSISKIKNAQLTAVCDQDKARTDLLAKELNCKAFYDVKTMLDSSTVDAILIATPHFFHTDVGIMALKRGIHVLVEKPISVHKADCERLIAARKDKKTVFAAMFNLRTDTHYKKVKELMDKGELGKFTRVNWIITNWFRSYAYYASGKWRATWKGEGGGVLLNQCPHNLDLLQWFCGMPKRLQGFCHLGKWHPIEVEDEVVAYLEFPNQATGVFVTSTGEAPGTNRLEICGEKGKLVLENGKLHFTRNTVEMSKFSRTTKELFSYPEVWEIDIPVRGVGGQHVEIIQNFVDAILNGTPLIAPAEEGMNSVELANAILYSSLTKKALDLPLNSKAYEKMLKKLMQNSGRK